MSVMEMSHRGKEFIGIAAKVLRAGRAGRRAGREGAASAQQAGWRLRTIDDV